MPLILEVLLLIAAAYGLGLGLGMALFRPRRVRTSYLDD